MNKFLFLLTIGPVQSFIAQARKTQDLYAGSLLLSQLVKTAIEELKERKDIIFPFAYPNDIDKWDDLESLPNRFVAVVNSSESELQKLGEDIETAVKAKWESLSTSAILDIGKNYKQLSMDKGFFEQIRQHLDIHWLFEPLTDNYKESFKLLERKMGAIKNVRTFEQYNYNGLGEKGRKCSLDGIRNVKFYRMTETQQKKGKEYIQGNLLFARDNCVFDFNTKLDPSILRPGEGLSATSFVKRCYLYKEKKKRKFESTAKIALMDWSKWFSDNNKSELLDKYKKLYKDFNEDNFNTQLFFDDNLDLDYFKNQGIKLEKGNDTLTEAKAELKKIVLTAKDGGIKQSKYYAIIAFDGDSMGKWLSKASSIQEHSDFSKLLMEFAKKAMDYINDKKGRTVYAGGDDFLGFVNLSYLFDVLIWLRDEFKKEVTNKVELKSDDEDDKFTFSAGIAIAHYKEPLSIVLSRAKGIEEKAKDWRDEKNSFGIAVLKGSGEQHETIWSFKDNSLEHIQYLVKKLQDGTFSNTFITNIQIEFGRLLDIDGKIGEDERFEMFRDLLGAEFERLVTRSLIKEEDSAITKIVNHIWTGVFIKQFTQNKEATIRNFFELLNIADFLQRSANSIKIKEAGL